MFLAEGLARWRGGEVGGLVELQSTPGEERGPGWRSGSRHPPSGRPTLAGFTTRQDRPLRRPPAEIPPRQEVTRAAEGASAPSGAGWEERGGTSRNTDRRTGSPPPWFHYCIPCAL